MTNEDQPAFPESLHTKLDELRQEQGQLRAQLEEQERGVLERRAEVREQEQRALRLRASLERRERQAKRLSAELERQAGRRGFLGRLWLGFRPYSELWKENAELRAEVKRLRKFEHLTKVTGGTVARLVTGSELREAFRSWARVTREAKIPRDLFSQESADLGTAILRRMIRVGLFGLLVAVLPVMLLVWQNLLLQRQVSQQASDGLIVRRAQLLDTIYDEVCEPAMPLGDKSLSTGGDATAHEGEGSEPDTVTEGAEEACRPKTHARARREATLAFIQIERNREVEADLGGANLGELWLSDADLSGTYLFGADLSHSVLIGANLRNVDLGSANLRAANLSYSDLGGAFLFHANLRDADLEGANLRGVKLLTAWNLTQEQIDSAVGDEETTVPEALRRPMHWSNSEPEAPESDLGSSLAGPEGKN